MDTILEQLSSLALQADTAGRHKVLDFIRGLQLKLETPHDTVSRLSGVVSSFISKDLSISPYAYCSDGSI
jgi:hypothetical protein